LWRSARWWILKSSDGSMTSLINGSVKTTFTNLSTGKTINANTSGPAKKTESADGSLVFASEGLTAIALEPPDAKRFGLPTLFVSAGSVTLSFTAEGDTTSVSLHGHALINVCAA